MTASPYSLILHKNLNFRDHILLPYFSSHHFKLWPAFIFNLRKEKKGNNELLKKSEKMKEEKRNSTSEGRGGRAGFKEEW